MSEFLLDLHRNLGTYLRKKSLTLGLKKAWHKITAMNILVTGGAGFIGSHTVDALIEAGHKVRILDNLQTTVHPKGLPPYIHPKADFIHGDVRDRRQFSNALNGIEAVYHLAAYQDYLTDFSTFFHVNAFSTALLYEIIVAAGQHAIKKVIVAASQAVMGEGRYRCLYCSETETDYIYPQIRLQNQLQEGAWEHRCPKCDRVLTWLPSDESVINPCNQYAISKYSQEQIALQLGKRYGIPSVVLRYSIVQGPRQSFYNAYSGAMRIFALSLFLGRRPLIFEDGHQVRDFINIYDVIDANLMVLENPSADYHVFNVGGGKAWTVSDFYHRMQEITGRNVAPLVDGHFRYGDTRHIFSDTKRINALGWKAKRDVTESIQQYWDYLNRQEEMDEILEFAQKRMQKLQVIRKIKQAS
jgi:dTDP-L-rhamnose 4-epimerase